MKPLPLLQEFKAFAMRGNVIDLAIGVIIGTSFGAIVTSLVEDVIMPPIGFLIGGIDFSSLAIPLGADAAIRYGEFAQALINFIIIAFALFLMLRTLNRLMHLKKQEEAAAKPVETEELKVLREIRDSLKKTA